MAWTATKTDVTKSEGTILVTVEYTDGVSPFSETYRSHGPPVEWIEKTVESRLAQLNIIDVTTIALGIVASPTPPDAGLVVMRAALRKLSIIEKLVALEVVPLTNVKIQAELDIIRADLLTYWDQI